MQFGNFKIFFLIFFITSISFSQTLEDQIYDSVDGFVANPNKKSLEVLNRKEKEFSTRVKSFDEQLALVIFYCNKGSFEMKSNFEKNALTSYEKGWKLFDKNKLSNYDIVEYCLKPLGTIYTKSGNFTLAENIIKKYIFIAEKENNQATIISGYINLSIVYKSIGKHQTAIDLLQKVSKNKAVSSVQSKRIQEEMAVNYIVLKKYENANQLLQNSDEDEYQNLKTKSFLSIQNNKVDEAINYFEKAKTAFFKNKNFTAREVAKMYVDEASIYQFLKQDKKTKMLLSKALQTLLPLEKKMSLPEKNSLYAENTFLAIFDGMAKLETNSKKKIDYYNLSFYVSDLIKDNIVSQESLIIQQFNDRKRTEKCLQIFWNEYQKSKDNSCIEKAFLFAEKSKNIVLKDKNQLKILLELHPKNKNLLLQNQLTSQQETLINKLIRLQITGENPNEIETINSKLASISMELKSYNEKIQKQFKKDINKSFEINTLYDKIKKDKAQLVYFFWGNESVYEFQIIDKKISWNKIIIDKAFASTLKNFIHSFDDASVINNDINLFTKISFKLYENLKLPNLQRNKNTIIIPDGLLNFVSFDALVTQKTTSKNYSKIPFLVFQNKLAYQTNATFYIENIPKEKQNTIVGFFPVFENTNAELLYSKEEAKALIPFNAKLFMNENASKENFLENCSKYSILHLSTHGTSGTFNEPATLVFYDDLMLIQELYALENCHPQLVVLSACETGIGKLQKGEGAMSIARAFQYAGAKNILFSLWKINDFATAQLMTNFYENFKKTNSFFESNYLSKMDYLEDNEISNTKKSPYYWSSFVYYGAVDSETNNYFYYLLFGGILIIILLLIYGRNSRIFKRKKI
ncbi:CHAT domain-containing tetratricopeptide repeat protein [uncultured Flavobacterium sp.]|uniref:CHAT domain-containing protein n=1 Tax=uncultured Flavobacterium sp. TaxID=165435 RepID=UPI0030ED614A|tara:strand:- start:865 stop:3447 length:2583 start_codon:yes stop_codon:yes gene_type:complete